MTRHRNPLLRKYEFETSRSYLANQFLKVLYLFHINPEDIYITPDFSDISQIEFRTTEKKRIQMYYVFRRLVGEVDNEFSIY